MPRPRKPALAADPRRRRTGEEARAEILDAAERRLVKDGPGGIRLQEVAADAGISHPAVLHHFGSREALVKEVCERRFSAIHEDLVRALGSASGGADELGALLDSVFHVLEGQGHGRVVFWLALEGMLQKRDELRLRDVGKVAHELRRRKRDGVAPGVAGSAVGDDDPPLEDTLHTVALAALALLAESVIGKSILRDAGLGDDKAARARFHAWLAELITGHLETAPR